MSRRQCPDHPHFCGFGCAHDVPGKVNPYCGNRGPLRAHMESTALACMRIDGHEGPHSAYPLHISAPVEWS